MIDPFQFNDPNAAYQTNAQYMASTQNAMADMEKARMQAQAAMYGSDASLAGTMYTGNTNFNVNDLTQAATTYRTLEQLKNAIELQKLQNANAQAIAERQYGSANYGYDRSLEGQKYQADATTKNNFLDYLARNFGAQQQSEASKYGALAGLRGTQYQTDAQQNMAGGRNATDLAVAKMQAEAAMAPSNAKMFTFGNTFPVILDIMRRKKII